MKPIGSTDQGEVIVTMSPKEWETIQELSITMGKLYRNQEWAGLFIKTEANLAEMFVMLKHLTRLLTSIEYAKLEADARS